MPQATKMAAGAIRVNCDPKWDACQKRQACAKVKKLNEKVPLTKRRVTAKQKQAKKYWQRFFTENWNNPSAPGWGSDNRPRGGDDAQWADLCAKANGKPLDADHIIDTQLGGSARGPLQILDRAVNQSLGRQIARKKQTEITKIVAVGCNCS